MVTPSFYCSFWVSYIWLTFVPSLKTIWIVRHFQGNYLNWVKSWVHLTPCKQMLHCWSTTTTLLECYMLHLFAHPVACCCILLGVVAQSLKPDNNSQHRWLVCTYLPKSDGDLKPEVFQKRRSINQKGRLFLSWLSLPYYKWSLLYSLVVRLAVMRRFCFNNKLY